MAKYKPPIPIKKRKLQKILRRHGCEIHPNMGAGSHWGMTRRLAGGRVLSYTVADHREYENDYINPIRRAMHLSKDHGITTRQFFEV